MDYLHALAGLVAFIGIAWLVSDNRKAISWKLVLTGFLLQLTFGILITQIEFVKVAFSWLSHQFVVIINFASAGADFLFGKLNSDSFGYIFAIRVLPTIIFFSSISAALYHLGILQKIVKGIAWVMARTMHLSGAESLSAAGNIFLGQTEAPLMVRPYISKMTSSELMCLMTGGMATIAGGVLAAYVSFLGGDNIQEQSNYATYLLSASIMNAPAAIVFSKILVPESNPEGINKNLNISSEIESVNVIDALARGAADGVKLALNVGGMLLAFIAVIAALNYILKDFIGEFTGLNELILSSTNGGFEGLTLEYILGSGFRVIAFLMGVEWSETIYVGSLLGQKTVLNEFIAYESLKDLKTEQILSLKSEIISAYALCGFANFSSIAIQIGGIGGMAPDRQGEISKFGLRALLAASLATISTATIAGVLF